MTETGYVPCDNKHVTVGRFDVMINDQLDRNDKEIIEWYVIQLKV